MNATRNSPIAAGLFVAIVFVGAVLRLYDLDRRLMHGDEANQAIKAAILLETGGYAYDPHEHHGPTLYYFSWAVENLLGHDARAAMTETSLRFVPALFGIATIGLVWLLRRALGVPGTLFAALLLALSPALTFYSRYYIQEILLTCFAFAALIGVWRYLTEYRLRWALLGAAGLSLMFATKETWVIPLAGLVAAAVAVRPWTLSDSSPDRRVAGHFLAAGGVALGVWLVFYSSFFTHWQGLVDSFGAYRAYLGRGSAPSVHDHPWHFYLARLVWHHRGPGPRWTEGFILATALLGIAGAVVRRNRFGLFLTVFALVVLAGFSLVRYKTPWNLIQFQAPLCLLGGAGLGWVWTVWRRPVARAALLVVVLAGSAHLAWLNYAANFTYPEYPYNPYVYGHTSSAFQRLINRIDTLEREHPDGEHMLMAVIQPDGDYWPLPWYLRRFERVGYWTSVPERLPDADVFIVNSTVSRALHETLAEGYRFETHGLRPGILRTVYIRKETHD